MKVLYIVQNDPPSSAQMDGHFVKFYIHGSVHRNAILIRSNKMQKYAGIYLLQVILQ